MGHESTDRLLHELAAYMQETVAMAAAATQQVNEGDDSCTFIKNDEPPLDIGDDGLRRIIASVLIDDHNLDQLTRSAGTFIAAAAARSEPSSSPSSATRASGE
jgi:hypothetical protein